jgi:hypothetical protein
MEPPAVRPSTREQMDQLVDNYVGLVTHVFEGKPDNTLGVALLGEFAWHAASEVADSLTRGLTGKLGEWANLHSIPKPFGAQDVAYLAASFGQKLAATGLKNVIVSTGTMITEVGKNEAGRTVIANMGCLITSDGEFIQVIKQAEAAEDPSRLLGYEFLGREDNQKPFRIADRYGDGYEPIAYAGVCLDVKVQADSLPPIEMGFVVACGVPAIMRPENAVYLVADTAARLPLDHEEQPSGVYQSKEAAKLQEKVGKGFHVPDGETSLAGLSVAVELVASSQPFFKLSPDSLDSHGGIQYLSTEVDIPKSDVAQETFEKLSSDKKRMWSNFFDEGTIDPNNFKLDPMTGSLIRKPDGGELDPTSEGGLDPNETTVDPNHPEHNHPERKPERRIFKPEHDRPGEHGRPRGERE